MDNNVDDVDGNGTAGYDNDDGDGAAKYDDDDGATAQRMTASTTIATARRTMTYGGTGDDVGNDLAMAWRATMTTSMAMAQRAAMTMMMATTHLLRCKKITQKINCSYNSNMRSQKCNKIVLAVFLTGFRYSNNDICKLVVLTAAI